MKRIFFAVITSLLFVFNLYSQNRISLEFTGGVISPIHSTNDGLLGTVQINYYSYRDNYLYANFSYSGWDKNKIGINDPNGLRYNLYSEENHSLFSIFIGDRYIFNRNKIFSAFVELELGYQNLNYTSVFPTRFINPDGTIEYLYDYGKKEIINENLVGLGLGLGIQHEITNNCDILLSIKLNSNMNNSYNGFFSSQDTYFTYSGGFLFNL